MKKTLLTNMFWLILLIFGAAFPASAQEENPNPNQNFDQNKRPVRILEELGLTREQIQQIRRINAQRKPLMQEAQRQLREANRNLDAAIYSDTADEEDIKAKMKEVQLAQAEVTKVKTLTEVLIRKVLTPEQLEKFRNLRQRMMQRQNNQTNQPNRLNNRNPQRQNQ